MNVKLSASLLAVILILGTSGIPQQALGFAFVFSGEEPEIGVPFGPANISDGVIYEDDVRATLEIPPGEVTAQALEDVVTHPLGYTGVGGALAISVGIDPTSAHAADMEQSLTNVVATWNALTPTTGNIMAGAIPVTDVDFESVLLHELGHAISLAHPNAATESGLTGADQDYTKATDGANDAFNIDDGVDNVIGSADDVRGDDDPLNWYRTLNNNPFTIGGTVDSTAYARTLASLPGGDLFPANPARAVGALLGFVDTEASMQQGTFFAETQRTLGHDDVAGLLYGMSGLDETQGNTDDYTVVLTDAGQDATADIVIDFDDSMTSFAVTFISGVFIATDHAAITSSSIFFHEDVPGSFEWFFTPEEVGDECGNNIVEGNEVCDEGDNNGTTTCGCTDSCTLPGSGTECRESSSSCDPAEFCDGAGSCDNDVLESEFTPCGDQSDTQCSNPNSCSDAGVCLARNEAPGFSCEADVCTDPDTCDDSGNCTEGPRLTTPECVPVGGELIPIDTTSLILAGTQATFSWMIPITISAIGIAIVIARKFSKYQPE